MSNSVFKINTKYFEKREERKKITHCETFEQCDFIKKYFIVSKEGVFGVRFLCPW
jgi:hypothetical protein